MSSRFTPVIAVVAITGACAVSLAAVASGRPSAPAPATDLRVLSGSAQVTASGHAPAVAATFTVANLGTATIQRYRARLELVSGSRRVQLADIRRGPLSARGRVTVAIRAGLGRDLAGRDWTIETCLSAGASASARVAPDGCRRLGSYDPPAPGSSTPNGATTLTQTAPTASTPDADAEPPTPSAPAPPLGTVPPDPVSGYRPDRWFFEADGRGQYHGIPNTITEEQAQDDGAAGFFTSGYWVDVPASYDETNQTPETLLVWLHGCSGLAENDVWHLSSEYTTDRPYIVISINGPEDAGTGHGPDCWDTSGADGGDVPQVMADITHVETEFDIDRRRVIIGGYSSGGDLAYQTIFTHADTFAGILAINTDPVNQNSFANDIGAAIAAAAWKFPIVQISHADDTTYPVGSMVRPHMADLQSAGFPVIASTLPGDHYDQDTGPADCEDATPTADCTSGTYYDIAHSLLPHIAADGWEGPGT